MGGSTDIPQWIKSNSEWWSKELISDGDFLKGIQYLVENSIISVKQISSDLKMKTIPSQWFNTPFHRLENRKK